MDLPLKIASGHVCYLVNETTVDSSALHICVLNTLNITCIPSNLIKE